MTRRSPTLAPALAHAPAARRSPATAARRPARRAARGFTMLEILVAIALVSLVMLAMNTFIFSMGELWGRNRGGRFFELHVRSVTRYLEAELRTASFPPYGTATTPAISVQEVRTPTSVGDKLLTFELPAGSRLINWPGRALPDVVCSLAVREREGLFLLWHSRHETRFADEPARETLITPLVTAMTYEYYDANFKRWQPEQNFRLGTDGQPETPGRIRLVFTYDGRKQEVAIPLPVNQASLPPF